MSRMLSTQNENYEPCLPSTESVGRTNTIRFSTIEVREFNCTLGDNPTCSRDPPISLEWDYAVSELISLDEYEAKRIPRRSRRELCISKRTRRKIVSSQLGYAKEEVEMVESSITRIQKKRLKTKKNYLMQKRIQWVMSDLLFCGWCRISYFAGQSPLKKIALAFHALFFGDHDYWLKQLGAWYITIQPKSWSDDSFNCIHTSTLCYH